MDEATRRRRQADYAAKHRQKAKTKRRPDARAVEHAYYVGLETFSMLVEAQIAIIAPKVDAAAVAKALREAHDELALLALSLAGYDHDQALEHISSMERETMRKRRRRLERMVDNQVLESHPSIQAAMRRMIEEGSESISRLRPQTDAGRSNPKPEKG